MTPEPDPSADAILTALKFVLPGLAATFGRSCEVVLHDYRVPEHSVVAVAGEVTGRHVGGAMSEIGLSVLARGDDAEPIVGQLTRTPSGRLVKSSTLPLRDARGRVFGALCVNLDATALQQVGDLLSDLLGGTAQPMPTTFTDDVEQVLDAVIRAETPGDPAALPRADRLPLIAALDRRGVFRLRGAAPKVAARLGVSRASLYADLAECRRTTDSGKEPTA
ncbi:MULTISPECIES: transcriptional regulator [Actinosynnema]|uniref:helix-turn-helix transcriptional regulator n=1 Tax=Actinosynnema TaxID=40566 RepID=UPI0020A52777|nr:helix-turn-helix transcriptional regulator [Actinosynnema pretiosum]MCP2092438.1 putative transcriptional regulator YheO, contains PAS and DNA-binding HTH domains [Actinosynnema pretiosum]